MAIMQNLSHFYWHKDKLAILFYSKHLCNTEFDHCLMVFETFQSVEETQTGIRCGQPGNQQTLQILKHPIYGKLDKCQDPAKPVLSKCFRLILMIFVVLNFYYILTQLRLGDTKLSKNKEEQGREFSETIRTNLDQTAPPPI